MGLRNNSIDNRENMVGRMRDFVWGFFRIPADADPADKSIYPELPLLMSLLDMAIDQKHQLGLFDSYQLQEMRDCLDYTIYAVLDAKLQSLPGNPHHELLEPLYLQGIEPTVISFNYDMIVDNTMISKSELECVGGRFPDYACDIASEKYKERGTYGRLLKLHGSLHWMYCPACQQLELYFSRSGQYFGKALEVLFQASPLDGYSCQGKSCSRTGCSGHVRPVMITPTHRKDYRNPHISRVWYEAQRALQQADRAIIIGYSLPPDDVEVIYLLKRGLAHLEGKQITVVDYSKRRKNADKHPVGQRFLWLFGPEIDWHCEGFQGWLAKCKKQSISPIDTPATTGRHSGKTKQARQSKRPRTSTGRGSPSKRAR
jgi:NAD-dependent SIR2 family protein deacetylase